MSIVSIDSVIDYNNFLQYSLWTVTKPSPQKRSVPTATPVAETVGLGITTKSVRHCPSLTAPTAVPKTVLSAPSTSPVTVKEYTSFAVCGM